MRILATRVSETRYAQRNHALLGNTLQRVKAPHRGRRAPNTDVASGLTAGRDSATITSEPNSCREPCRNAHAPFWSARSPSMTPGDPSRAPLFHGARRLRDGSSQRFRGVRLPNWYIEAKKPTPPARLGRPPSRPAHLGAEATRTRALKLGALGSPLFDSGFCSAPVHPSGCPGPTSRRTPSARAVSLQ